MNPPDHSKMVNIVGQEEVVKNWIYFFLIRAIQDQYEEIEELKEGFEDRLADLEERLVRM